MSYEPIFDPIDVAKQSVDRDQPIRLVVHEKAMRDAMSIFYLMDLAKASDLESIQNYLESKDQVILGCFTNHDEAIAYKEFCMLQRCKQYTPYIGHALAIDSPRPFIARVGPSTLVRQALWISITAKDYKTLSSLVPVRPVMDSELDDIYETFQTIPVTDLEPFKVVRFNRLSFTTYQTDHVEELESVLRKINQVVTSWRYICGQCLLSVGGKENLRTNIDKSLEYAGFDLDWADNLIEFYRDPKHENYLPPYPKIKLEDNLIDFY